MNIIAVALTQTLQWCSHEHYCSGVHMNITAVVYNSCTAVIHITCLCNTMMNIRTVFSK